MKKTVGAVIEDKGKILLIKRNHEPFRGYWGLPGGHIDEGENAEKAVIREVKEETNLSFKPKFFTNAEEHIDEINWHASVEFFTGVWEGEVKLSNEHTEYCWFAKAKIKKIDLAFNHKKILEEYWRSKQWKRTKLM